MTLSKNELDVLVEKGFYEIAGESFHIFIFRDINDWTVQHEIIKEDTFETFPTWKNMTFNELVKFDIKKLIDDNGF